MLNTCLNGTYRTEDFGGLEFVQRTSYHRVQEADIGIEAANLGYGVTINYVSLAMQKSLVSVRTLQFLRATDLVVSVELSHNTCCLDNVATQENIFHSFKKSLAESQANRCLLTEGMNMCFDLLNQAALQLGILSL
jgi:hypothetical protein